ncbi:MAG TPA: N-glycosylase/DNA lyase [Caldisericia bacterium]|nr:N-glycosylase/DNA lyase [Caldisericia bacterium]
MLELKESYYAKKSEIEKRILEFKKVSLSGSDEEIFYELAFCLLTPQSKAKVCWKAIENIAKNEITLNKESKEDISKSLCGVRFKNNKADYILNAKELFLNNGKIKIKERINSFASASEAREWLVKNVKGMGYKEASHFLRNIGFADDLAILDRHILKNLKIFGIIEEIPKSLSKKKYLEIEEKMRNLANEVNIPVSHLDLLFWSKETGEIFK